MPHRQAFRIALAATLAGLITFLLSWNFFDYWGGPIFGYQVLLFPGNMSLIYFWHPIFTEEVDLVPKVAMILAGQFTIVFVVAFSLLKVRLLFKEKAYE